MEKLTRAATKITTKRPVRILQFGGGNFLRAFVNWMVDILNLETDFNAGVIIVKPTKHGDYAALREQDGLFHVVVEGLKDGKEFSEVSLIQCVNDVIHPYKEWDKFLYSAEEPELRFVISNTTEAGIAFSEKDDFNVDSPKEFPAKLTRWLYHRFLHFKGDAQKGCIILPCELVPDNDKALRETILRYVSHWGLGEEFKTWLLTCNYFCGTLVDRIVSGYPHTRADDIQKELGFEDVLLVTAEAYHSWVIRAPAHVRQELPFENTGLNVRFVEDLSAYRELKVRILNGAHTSMVPMAYLAGFVTVKEAIDDNDLYGFLYKMLCDEVGPSLIAFSKEEVHSFIEDVFIRFKNPSLNHFLLNIALNSIPKFRQRLLPSFEDFLTTKDIFPKRIAFSLACLILFYKGEFNGMPIAIKDDETTVQFFKTTWSKIDHGKLTMDKGVEKILANQSLFGQGLSGIEGLTAYITQIVQSVLANGVKSELQKI